MSTRRPLVLLVERPQDDRRMYAEYLRALGFGAVEVGNTRDALRAASLVDVVVTGVRIPGPFDGLELVRRLRVQKQTPQQPIIVLTACAFDPDRHRAHEAGCDVFLAKPCFPDALVGEIRRLLGSVDVGSRRVRA